MSTLFRGLGTVEMIFLKILLLKMMKKEKYMKGFTFQRSKWRPDFCSDCITPNGDVSSQLLRAVFDKFMIKCLLLGRIIKNAFVYNIDFG